MQKAQKWPKMKIFDGLQSMQNDQKWPKMTIFDGLYSACKMLQNMEQNDDINNIFDGL